MAGIPADPFIAFCTKTFKNAINRKGNIRETLSDFRKVNTAM